VASTEVAVIGAGPAGLMAALTAARRGHDVTVLEAADRVGGMAGSFEVAGQRVDFGSHRLHPSIAPSLLNDLRAMLGDDLQTRTRHGRLRLGDRWVAFPLRTGDLVRSLPPGFTARSAAEAAVRPLRRPPADTFGEVVRSQLGTPVARDFYEPYARKLWGLEPDELSGELARRRISARGPGDLVRSAVRGSRGTTPFLYPARGYGQISEQLADALHEVGGRVRLAARVERIDLDPHPAVGLADGETLGADHVWSTLALPLLAGAVRPAPPPEVVLASRCLEYRAMVLVYLVVDRARYTEFDAHYLPSDAVAVSRLSEAKNYRDNPADPPDRTVLCAEVPCTVDDELWNATSADLGLLVDGVLQECGLPATEFSHVEVRRLPRVYPVYRLRFEDDLGVLADWVDGLPGLVAFGRPGLFVADNTHHVLAMGRAAGECLRPDGTFDSARWNRALAGFEQHVVED
jgi:protoporphyrinogen oxidase